MLTRATAVGKPAFSSSRISSSIFGLAFSPRCRVPDWSTSPKSSTKILSQVWVEIGISVSSIYRALRTSIFYCVEGNFLRVISADAESLLKHVKLFTNPKKYFELYIQIMLILVIQEFMNYFLYLWMNKLPIIDEEVGQYFEARHRKSVNDNGNLV